MSADFTVGIWVNRNTTASTNVMGQGNPSRGTGTGWIINIQSPTTGAGNRVGFSMMGTPTGGVNSTNPLLAGVWAFITGVYDHTAATCKLYMDGLLQGTSSTFAVSPATAPLWIGQDGPTGGISVDVPQFVGSYAFVIPSVLSGAQILEIYNSALLPAGADTGKALLATGLGGTEWDFAVEVDTVRYRGIELGTNLAGTDNGDHTVTIDAAGGSSSFDPATATSWWFPLVDSDGTCVLDDTGNLIPTLIAL
jgi:hypothetical protein